MKRLAIVLSLLAATVAVDGRRTEPDRRSDSSGSFPPLRHFSPKGGDPPHVKAYDGETPAWLRVLDHGASAARARLRRADRDAGRASTRKGILTGVVVVEHHEPYGDFSIDPPAFAAQFKGKDVRDPFKLGDDIDAVSRATITMSSAVRDDPQQLAAHRPAVPDPSGGGTPSR